MASETLGTWRHVSPARRNLLPDRRLAGDTCRQLPSVFDAIVCKCHLAGQPSLPGATRFQSHCNSEFRLTALESCQAITQWQNIGYFGCVWSTVLW
ncbi:hypothetical protein DEO72_LG9g1223 [Vigna unguiculata]|uniref:Uncharacterized protein n=1 Tax=Vigna unguiculata TaxID=3917 RepID=A0A4D6MZW0_VIGUN|nr:hypothetical protein DEO72_LG9g1223 [Vigna unguiculata]